MSKSVYVASSLHNIERVNDITEKLLSYGYTLTYCWASHGMLTDTTKLADVGYKEAKGVIDADLLFFICPGRTGAHVELGIAIAQIMLGINKTIIFLEDVNVEQKSFYYLPFIHKYADETSALEHARKLI